jgi:hypothetical protein
LKKILSIGTNDNMIMDFAFDTLMNGKRRAVNRVATFLGLVVEKHSQENEKLVNKLFDLLENESDNTRMKTLGIINFKFSSNFRLYLCLN